MRYSDKRVNLDSRKAIGHGEVMKKIFIIGGMGAGKSTVLRAFKDQGVPLIDLDKIGHMVLTWDTVKDDLRLAFGPEVFDDQGEVNRAALAAVAFASEHSTHKLNRISLPRIEEALTDEVDRLALAGAKFVVIEYSAFKGKENSLASDADYIVAVVAPLEDRVARAVAHGWDEQDVRARIARQISDDLRREAADVVFSNDGTPEQLYEQVSSWWREFSAKEGW